MKNKYHYLKIIRYIGGMVYIVLSLVILFIYLNYIITNISSLITTGDLKKGPVNSIDNFLFDVIIFIFYIASVIYTVSSILQSFFPDIRINPDPPSPLSTAYEVIEYTSTDEEKLVLAFIREYSPRAYKFEIPKSTGLSKMKIHRIISRFEERGIINAESIGRNTRIRLSDWLSNPLTTTSTQSSQ